MRFVVWFVGIAAVVGAVSLLVLWQRAEAAEEARVATLEEVETLLSQTIGRADRAARSVNRVLSPLPVMTNREEEALRRFRNAAHVARAREIGTRVGTREDREALVDAGRLVQLEDSTRHWIVRRSSSAQVVPELRDLLIEIGERFHRRLADMGLPPYRMEITSALRTTEGQARLRRTNANAAAGVSSHEFGTTVDLSYAAFAPPADAADEILTDPPPAFAPHFERIVDLAMESVSARKSRELGAIFSQVLTEAQNDGIALVIYERQQTIYHLTVGGPQIRSVN